MVAPDRLAGRDVVGEALRRDRLGVGAVLNFIVAAAAPLVVIAGVVATGFAVTGVTGIPVAFVAMAVVLVVFAIGYTAMARHVVNAGAFYAYIAHGLGRPAGVAAAWVALVAYNLLTVGLYGGIGVVAGPVLERWFGVSPSWWLVAGVAWLVVAVLGLLRIDVNGRVLAVLLLAEVAVVIVYDLASLANPAGGSVSFDALAPGNLAAPGAGAILVLAILGFVGFEQSTVYAEESKNRRRTVPAATYLALVLVGALYAVSAWAMTVAAGPAGIVTAAQEQGPELLFGQATRHLGEGWADAGHALFLTSLFAGMVAFHNTTARYVFALGRERVLPRVFGTVGRRTGAPVAGSLAQSAVGLAVIVAYSLGGWDPLVQLFFWGGTSGALGILALVLATSVSVVVYFLRDPHREPVWRRLLAPVAATLLLGWVVWLAAGNLALLFGVAPDSPLVWIVPTGYGLAALVGLLWGLVLRGARPDIYAGVGRGARAVSQPSGAAGRYTGPAPASAADEAPLAVTR